MRSVGADLGQAIRDACEAKNVADKEPYRDLSRSKQSHLEAYIDENRVKGAARNWRGKAQEGVAQITGDTKTKTEGFMNQAAGSAQDLYGQTADVVRQTADTLND